MTTNPQDQTEQELKKPEFQFEIFKLEYEQAAQRYENIYKAIWQIFSYMTVLAAAIVTFGANNLPLSAVVFFAPCPLIFWLFAIYIPMDFYGQQCREQLLDTENNINTAFLKYSQIKLSHFSKFSAERKLKCQKPAWRVNRAVWVFAVVAAIIWLCFLVMAFTNSNQSEPKFSRMEIKVERPVKVQTQPPQLQRLENKLELLSTRLDSIESLLRARNLATSNNNVGKSR